MVVMRYPGLKRRAPPETRPSGQPCHQCGEDIEYGGHVTLVHAVVLELDEVGQPPLTPPVLSEMHEPLYDPRLFHEECFDSTMTHMRVSAVDVLPIRTTDAARSCCCCTNSILFGERCALVEVGRLEPRVDGLHAMVNRQDAGVICMVCINRLADDFEADDAGTEIWSEMAQDQECSSCTDDCCWRDESCDCPCHDENDIEEYEEEDDDGDSAYR